MTSCLSLKTALVSVWQVLVLPFCALGCDKPLCLLPGQTLQVLCSSGIPSVSCTGPRERDGSTYCVESIACGLSPLLGTLEGTGTEVPVEDPKEN